jgi:hypothetical protein
MQMKMAARYASPPLPRRLALFAHHSKQYNIDNKMLMRKLNSPHKHHHQTTTLSHANQLISDHAHTHAHRLSRPIHSHKRSRPSNPLDDKENESQHQNKAKEQPQTWKFGALAGLAETKKVDLSACYICHRKPTELRHLDDYADCEACGKRTCYVCIRQCEGLGLERGLFGGQEFAGEGDYDLRLSWHGDEMCVEGVRKDADADLDGKEVRGGSGSGRAWEGERRQHSRRVCSRCCVERGPEGEVWCLGCLKCVEGD